MISPGLIRPRENEHPTVSEEVEGLYSFDGVYEGEYEFFEGRPISEEVNFRLESSGDITYIKEKIQEEPALPSRLVF